MWLLPLFSWIARTAATLFYRLRIEGRAPPRGPVLLVANHPNSLLDPALVVAAADRPVRFLAKAPLFADPRVGWLIRAVGSIPVVRRMDDPSASTESNEDMFRAAYGALSEGAAIGLFPEGTSHSDPQLKPLKTGAARIALGASEAEGLLIVPVGLVFRGGQKAIFRSEALVLFGEPLSWDDLRSRGPEPEAVRDLTERIDRALRQVSINAEHWEDLPLIECAEAIWIADRLKNEGAARSKNSAAEAQRIERLHIATELLARQRRTPQPPPDGGAGPTLVERIAAHRARLDVLGLDPAGVASETGWRQALRWALARIHLLGLPALLLAALGFVAFWIPFKLTGWWVKRLDLPTDQISTNKLLFGTVFYALWLGLVCGGIGFAVGRFHLLAGIAAALLSTTFLLLCGVVGLLVRERWRTSAQDVRRFLALTTRRRLVADLAGAQADLASEIDALVRAER